MFRFTLISEEQQNEIRYAIICQIANLFDKSSIIELIRKPLSYGRVLSARSKLISEGSRVSDVDFSRRVTTWPGGSHRELFKHRTIHCSAVRSL